MTDKKPEGQFTKDGKFSSALFLKATALFDENMKKQDKEKQEQREEKAHDRTVAAAKDVIKHSNGSTENGDNENANKIEEREVINTTPVKGKCYQHVLATKQVNTNEGTKYYTNKSNEYVGKFVKGLNYGDKGYTSVFEKDGKEINIQHDENGNTVFIDATCQDSQEGGKKKKRKTLKKRKTKKNKKKKSRKTKSKK